MPPLHRWEKFLPLVFLFCALPSGLGQVLLTPLGYVSDEPQHIARSAGLLCGQVVGTTLHGSATAGVMMNAALFAALLTEDRNFRTPLPPALEHEAQAVGWNDRRFGTAQVYSITQMVRYFPAFYVPGALGILAARTLRMTPLDSLYLGRGFMLLSFLSMGAAALHFARFGGPLLFAILLLPMTLYLAGSFNQDGQIIAAAALAAGLLTRARAGPNFHWLLALALLTLIASAKAPYWWLILACLPPLFAFGVGRRSGLVAVAATLPVFWLWVARQASNWPWARAAYYPGPLWTGPRTIELTANSVRGNVEVLLAHPAQIILLPVKSLIMQAPALGQQMVGLVDWETLPLARWQYVGWAVAVAAALLALVFRGEARGRSFSLLLLLATVLSVALSAYITFTNLGKTSIDGLRGRYFLPILPFFLFFLPLAPRWRKLPPLSWIAAVPAAVYCLPAVLMAVLDVYALPAQLWRVFRMAGP